MPALIQSVDFNYRKYYYSFVITTITIVIIITLVIFSGMLFVHGVLLQDP